MDRLMTPPYKIAFKRYLKKYLKESEPFESILDCASAGDKNINLFKNKQYTGVDISSELIESAINRHENNSKNQFCCADFSDKNWLLTGKKFDLVVCTHTLAHIKKEDKETALSNLFDCVNSDGKMILEISKSDFYLINNFIQKKMKIVGIVRYRGILSKMIVYLNQHKKSFKNSIINYCFSIISFLFSFIDFSFFKEEMILLLKNPDAEF